MAGAAAAVPNGRKKLESAEAGFATGIQKAVNKLHASGV